MSSSGYASWYKKIYFFWLKILTRRTFPTRLGYHHLLSKGVTLHKENDGNLHAKYTIKHKHKVSPVHEQMSIITSIHMSI